MSLLCATDAAAERQSAGVGFISELEGDVAEECSKLGPLVRL